MNYELHIAEIQFNIGVCLILSHKVDQGLNKLRIALLNSTKPEHEIIGKILDNINNVSLAYVCIIYINLIIQVKSLGIYSIPVGSLFHPSENKMKNLAVKVSF